MCIGALELRCGHFTAHPLPDWLDSDASLSLRCLGTHGGKKKKEPHASIR